jgi:hypothetical protein
MTRSRLACALLVFCALTGPIAGAQPDQSRASTRRALLIGIDKYLPRPANLRNGRPGDPVSNLEGSMNDVLAMKAVLIARYGFKAANVHILSDTQATRERILAETRDWLVRAPAPGDVSVFYYAGHGSQVRNSLSPELDKLDETIVPTDANLGRRDIRDKELARLFNQALDKGVVLTAIFDSCHSGSIARGPSRARPRFASPDTRDVADPEVPAPPESRGALVLSAALDMQLSDEVLVPEEGDAVHGLFTWALVRTLRTMPVTESAQRAFLRVHALLQSGAYNQEPGIAGTEARKRASLFGTGAPASTDSAIAVQSIEANGIVMLQAGPASGVRPGAELTAIGDPKGPTLRVVRTEGIALSRARAISGSAASIRPGALFTLTKWAAPPGLVLRVAVPSDLVIPAEVIGVLRSRTGPQDRLFEIQSTLDGAHYALARQVLDGVPEYSWVRPTPRRPDEIVSALPDRTAWVPLGHDPAATANALRDLAVRLSVVRSWIGLESPPASDAFPFHLALKRVSSGELMTGGSARDGEYLDPVLTRDDAPIRFLERRYVYVFTIGDTGESKLIFPRPDQGNVENLLPLDIDSPGKLPLQIPLGAPGLMRVGTGIDTIFLLTTATPLPDPNVLEGEAVRPPDTRAGLDPLSLLLSGGLLDVGNPVTTPTGWSIERITIRTRPDGER